jgi:hypothetical protein
MTTLTPAVEQRGKPNVEESTMRIKSLVLLGLIAILAGYQAGTSGPTKLTIAALQGDESLGLKAIAADCGTKSGTTVEIVENPYSDLYDKLVTTFKANDATFDLVMIDDPWTSTILKGSFQDLGQFGIERDPDIASIVWDVGTWPPPHGAVPPSEKDKAAKLLGVTVVGNVEMFMNRSDIVPAPKTYDDVLANAKAQSTRDCRSASPNSVAMASADERAASAAWSSPRMRAMVPTRSTAVHSSRRSPTVRARSAASRKSSAASAAVP